MNCVTLCEFKARMQEKLNGSFSQSIFGIGNVFETRRIDQVDLLKLSQTYWRAHKNS